MTAPTAIWPDRHQRLAEQARLSERLADTLDSIQAGPVANTPTPAALRAALSRFDFRTPQATGDVADAVTALLRDGIVHVMHPGYLGLYNPSVAFPALLADQITATLNPQMAAWSQAAAASEIELHTLKAFAVQFGWSADSAGGHFTSGGTEANLTAVVCALTHAFPGYGEDGALAIGGFPKMYVSAESHLAWLKIAHQCGIGRQAVRLIATDGLGQMDERALSIAIQEDRQQGHRPFFIGATAGTTNAGMIDPIKACARIAQSNDLWLHVDAAWGGAAILSATPPARLAGMDAADSITLDAHKWLAAPMGAGMFLCRREALLAETFRVSANYMPSAVESVGDPYTHSVQWSRRFIGLKLFMALAVLGWDGFRAHIDFALELADRLAALLEANGWNVVNASSLGVVCFVDAQGAGDPGVIAQRVVADGRAWISAARFEGRPVLRACITSHFTRLEHLEALVAALDDARQAPDD